MREKILFIFLFFLLPMISFSQIGQHYKLVSQKDSFNIEFPNHSFEIKTNYLNNSNSLKQIEELMFFVGQKEIDSITIVIIFSSNDNTPSNRKLSKKRAKSIKNYFNLKYSHIPVSKFKIKTDDVKRNVVIHYYKRNYNISYIQNQNSLIEKEYEKENQIQVKAFQDSIAHNYEKQKYNLIDSVSQTEQKTQNKIEFTPIFQESPSNTLKNNSFTFYLKTNLLYYLALAPNIEVEVPIKNFSINFDYLFPWYVNAPKRFCYQLLLGGIEGRYWIKKTKQESNNNPLTGFFVGAYLQRGIFDFQNSDKGVQGDVDFLYGISFGYTKPISNYFNLEFSLGLGYFNSKNINYYAYENILLRENNSDFRYFGPTKAKVSLVWKINSRRAEK